MNWSCPVCENNFSRKDNMQRHMSSKHNNPGFTPFGGMFNSREKSQRFHFIHPFTCMAADRFGKDGLGPNFTATGSKRNLPTTRENCLVLLTMATRLHCIGGNYTADRICQGYST